MRAPVNYDKFLLLLPNVLRNSVVRLLCLLPTRLFFFLHNITPYIYLQGSLLLDLTAPKSFSRSASTSHDPCEREKSRFLLRDRDLPNLKILYIHIRFYAVHIKREHVTMANMHYRAVNLLIFPWRDLYNLFRFEIIAYHFIFLYRP